MSDFDEIVPPPADGRRFDGELRPGLGDAAPSGRVRLDAIARWLQDVAHADVADAGLATAARWVVRRTRLRVLRFPHFGERVSLVTFCSGLGRLWAQRRTTVMTDGGGHVEAVALWVHLNPADGRPMPLGAREVAVYGAAAAGRVVKARLRHPPPPSDALSRPWWFRASELDLADHVNNAAFWTPLEDDLLAAAPEPAALDAELEFRTPAQPGRFDILESGTRRWIVGAQGEVHASADLRLDGRNPTS